MAAGPPSDNTYVTDLPVGIDDTLVKQIFGAYGATVVQCRILTERAGADGNVHALVRFASADEATQVVEKLSGQILQGLEKPINIRYATPGGGGGGMGGKAARPGPYDAVKGANPHNVGPGSLYIAGLPSDCEVDTLKALFAEYGTVVRATMLRSNNHPSGKRAALVDYSSGEEAQQVIELFHNQIIPGLSEPVQIEYNFAVKAGGKGKGEVVAGGFAAFKGAVVVKGKGEGKTVKPPIVENPDDSIKAIVEGLESLGALPGGKWTHDDERCIFVGGLPADTTDLEIYRIFSTFGAIQAGGVKALMQGGICKGVAFVNYVEESAAQHAISVLNECQLPNGGVLTVKIKEDGATGGPKGAFAKGDMKGGKKGCKPEVAPTQTWNQPKVIETNKGCKAKGKSQPWQEPVEEAAPEPVAEFAASDPLAEFAASDPFAEFAATDPLAEFAATDPLAEFAATDPLAEFAATDPLAEFAATAASEASKEAAEEVWGGDAAWDSAEVQGGGNEKKWGNGAWGGGW